MPRGFPTIGFVLGYSVLGGFTALGLGKGNPTYMGFSVFTNVQLGLAVWGLGSSSVKAITCFFARSKENIQTVEAERITNAEFSNLYLTLYTTACKDAESLFSLSQELAELERHVYEVGTQLIPKWVLSA